MGKKVCFPTRLSVCSWPPLRRYGIRSRVPHSSLTSCIIDDKMNSKLVHCSPIHQKSPRISNFPCIRAGHHYFIVWLWTTCRTVCEWVLVCSHWIGVNHHLIDTPQNLSATTNKHNHTHTHNFQLFLAAAHGIIEWTLEKLGLICGNFLLFPQSILYELGGVCSASGPRTLLINRLLICTFHAVNECRPVIHTNFNRNNKNFFFLVPPIFISSHCVHSIRLSVVRSRCSLTRRIVCLLALLVMYYNFLYATTIDDSWKWNAQYRCLAFSSA